MPDNASQPNFLYLLVGLLVVLLTGPISQELLDDPSGALLQAAFSGTLLIGVWSLQTSPTLFKAGIALAVMAVVATALHAMRPTEATEFATLIIVLTFCLFSFAFTLKNILVGLHVDANRLMGAICAYVLIGVIWSLFYLIVEFFLPGSFAGKNLPAEAGKAWDLIYYSFVTMTTLGYGDVVPVRPLAQSLAYMEALLGQLYIAILVGMMVGMYLSGRGRSD